MEKEPKPNARQVAIKISFVALITLLMLIPLAMITGVIEEREETKDKVIQEVAFSYGKQQTVFAPKLISHVIEEIEITNVKGEIEKDTNNRTRMGEYVDFGTKGTKNQS